MKKRHPVVGGGMAGGRRRAGAPRPGRPPLSSTTTSNGRAVGSMIPAHCLPGPTGGLADARRPSSNTQVACN